MWADDVIMSSSQKAIFVRLPRLIQTCAMTHSYACHDSFMCLPRLIHLCPIYTHNVCRRCDQVFLAKGYLGWRAQETSLLHRYIHTCVCICVCTHICKYVNTRLCISTPLVHRYIHTCICICMCIHIFKYKAIYINTPSPSVHTYVYLYLCMYTHMCKCIRVHTCEYTHLLYRCVCVL